MTLPNTCSTLDERKVDRNSDDIFYLRSLVSGSTATKISMFFEILDSSTKVLTRFMIIDLDVADTNQVP